MVLWSSVKWYRPPGKAALERLSDEAQCSVVHSTTPPSHSGQTFSAWEEECFPVYYHATTAGHSLYPYNPPLMRTSSANLLMTTPYTCVNIFLPSHAFSNTPFITSSSHAVFTLLPVPILCVCDLGLFARTWKTGRAT
jgi:hypothetical protein